MRIKTTDEEIIKKVVKWSSKAIRKAYVPQENIVFGITFNYPVKISHSVTVNK
jgi:hypothetical protein